MSQTTNGSLALNQAEKKVIVIAAAEQPESMKLRVAAYCRVSSSSEDQLNSFAAQNHYYTSLICSQENWHLVDVYADEGITGTSVQKRSDFQRLLADCRKGKIDRILVKSLSRFARNTKECLETIRELKALGVTIQFEKEHIDTATMSGEMTTAMYAAFAQGESESISKNTLWGIEKRMAAGSYVAPSIPFGYRRKEGKLVICDEEADYIRWIFRSYLEGVGADEIAETLQKKSSTAPVLRSRRWSFQGIIDILKNERYVGDSLFQKTYTTRCLPKQNLRNRGERVQYYVAETHPAIVDRKEFCAVQELIENRKKPGKRIPHSVLSGQIFCGVCGSKFRKKDVHGKVYWNCYTHGNDVKLCPVREIPDAAIQEAFFRLYYKLKHSTVLQDLLRDLYQLRSCQMLWSPDVVALNGRISQLSSQSHALAVLKQQGLVDPDIFIAKSNGLAEQLRKAKQEKERCLEASGDSSISSTRVMLEVLEAGPEFLDALDEELFCELIEKIIVDSNTQLRFLLRNGLELTEQIGRTVR